MPMLLVITAAPMLPAGWVPVNASRPEQSP